MARSRSLARPVLVTQPATMPAMEQAAATEMVPLAPASRESSTFIKEMLSEVSSRPRALLTKILTIPTMMEMIIAIAAEKAMLRVPVETRTTRIIKGSSRYSLGASSLNLGSWSLGIPFRPSFLASRWTAIKIPAKYRKAGKMASTTIS